MALCFIGAVHKRRPQSGGERVCPVRIFLGQRGREGSSCGRPHFLAKKNLRIFRNLWCVRTDKGGGGRATDYG